MLPRLFAGAPVPDSTVPPLGGGVPVALPSGTPAGHVPLALGPNSVEVEVLM